MASMGSVDAEISDYWREHVSAWGLSGESARSYCLRQGLSLAAFHRWRRELRRHAVLAGTVGESSRAYVERAVFAEVSLEEVTTPRRNGCETSALEISLGAHRHVLIRPGFDEETLTRVISVLERM